MPSEALAFAPGTSFDTAGLFDISGAGLGSDVLGDPAIANFGDTFGAGATDLSGSTTGVTGTDAGFTSPAAGGGAGAAPGGAGATPSVAANEEWAGLTAPSATDGGGGFLSGATDKLGGIMSSPWTKLALAGAPLALTLGMGEAQLSPAAQQLQAQANALSQQGMSDLASARAGKLNAGQTAQLASDKQDLTNQWRQTLYNQGVTDISKDARWPQIEAAIDQQITKETAQLIQQNITNALAETGQASTALTSIAQMQLAADTAFTNQLINATKSLGLAAGGGQTITLKAA